MKPLLQQQFDQWRKNAEVIERDGHGEKVLKLADGSFVKIFRRKSLLSKSLLIPPATRFAKNAAALQQRGIRCPVVIATYRMNSPHRSLVHYHPLEGKTLREIAKHGSTEEKTHTFRALPPFITSLHESGIYFRSLHFGNIIVCTDGQFGLIDISDMRCFDVALGRSMRKRNQKHLLRYKSDWEALETNLRTELIHAITDGNIKS